MCNLIDKFLDLWKNLDDKNVTILGRYLIKRFVQVIFYGSATDTYVYVFGELPFFVEVVSKLYENQGSESALDPMLQTRDKIIVLSGRKSMTCILRE